MSTTPEFEMQLSNGIKASATFPPDSIEHMTMRQYYKAAVLTMLQHAVNVLVDEEHVNEEMEKKYQIADELADYAGIVADAFLAEDAEHEKESK